MARWDYKMDGETFTRAPDDTILELLSHKRLKLTDMISPTGKDDWKTVAQTPMGWEHRRREEFAARNTVDLPKSGRPRGAELYVAWFVLTGIGTYITLNTAQSYNPEGNGLFNLVEASLLNHVWIQVVAALLCSIFTSLFFAALLIAGRLRTSVKMSRAATIAMIVEMRLTREAIERLAAPADAERSV